VDLEMLFLGDAFVEIPFLTDVTGVTFPALFWEDTVGTCSVSFGSLARASWTIFATKKFRDRNRKRKRVNKKSPHNRNRSEPSWYKKKNRTVLVQN
jgi:hypothetical protein